MTTLYDAEIEIQRIITNGEVGTRLQTILQDQISRMNSADLVKTQLLEAINALNIYDLIALFAIMHTESGNNPFVTIHGTSSTAAGLFGMINMVTDPYNNYIGKDHIFMFTAPAYQTFIAASTFKKIYQWKHFKKNNFSEDDVNYKSIIKRMIFWFLPSGLDNLPWELSQTRLDVSTDVFMNKEAIRANPNIGNESMAQYVKRLINFGLLPLINELGSQKPRFIHGYGNGVLLLDQAKFSKSTNSYFTKWKSFIKSNALTHLTANTKALINQTFSKGTRNINYSNRCLNLLATFNLADVKSNSIDGYFLIFCYFRNYDYNSIFSTQAPGIITRFVTNAIAPSTKQYLAIPEYFEYKMRDPSMIDKFSFFMDSLTYKASIFVFLFCDLDDFILCIHTGLRMKINAITADTLSKIANLMSLEELTEIWHMINDQVNKRPTSVITTLNTKPLPRVTPPIATVQPPALNPQALQQSNADLEKLVGDIMENKPVQHTTVVTGTNHVMKPTTVKKEEQELRKTRVIQPESIPTPSQTGKTPEVRKAKRQIKRMTI